MTEEEKKQIIADKVKTLQAEEDAYNKKMDRARALAEMQGRTIAKAPKYEDSEASSEPEQIAVAVDSAHPVVDAAKNKGVIGNIHPYMPAETQETSSEQKVADNEHYDGPITTEPNPSSKNVVFGQAEAPNASATEQV